MLILSYENKFNLHVNENSFSYERMSTNTRFENEAKGNSEMAYSLTFSKHHFYENIHGKGFCIETDKQHEMMFTRKISVQFNNILKHFKFKI